MARRWAELAGSKTPQSDLSPGVLLALAYPDRVARNRGAAAAFVLANGEVPMWSQLPHWRASHISLLRRFRGRQRLGDRARCRLTLTEIEQHFSEKIENRDEISFDERV